MWTAKLLLVALGRLLFSQLVAENHVSDVIEKIEKEVQLTWNDLDDTSSEETSTRRNLEGGLLNKAEQFYQWLFDKGFIIDMSFIDLIVNCYIGLSDVCRKQGEIDIALAYNLFVNQILKYALEYFFQALDIFKELNLYHDILRCYDVIALNAKLKYEPTNDPNVAESYELIGGLYHQNLEFILE
ncbi:hypothetical protein I4U23_016902 [Adineta vaga]|nr:hypothetical protein I4U23_016902 [Adineta vaga]